MTFTHKFSIETTYHIECFICKQEWHMPAFNTNDERFKLNDMVISCPTCGYNAKIQQLPSQVSGQDHQQTKESQ